MNFPAGGDFIDIHNHGGISRVGQFSVENLMAHEERVPDNEAGLAYTYGIHPWHLSPESYNEQITKVRLHSVHENVIAIGEAGFDRLKGASNELQQKAFREQVEVSIQTSRPLFIHCVRAWEDLLAVHKTMRPPKPWIIHGFRGKKELAMQLISKGMYISFWFDFILRAESTPLVKDLPADRIFLETDGSGVAIETIYEKVSADLGVETGFLKRQIYNNFKELFSK